MSGLCGPAGGGGGGRRSGAFGIVSSERSTTGAPALAHFFAGVDGAER